MRFQFTHPLWLLALAPALGWVAWLTATSYAQISPWRRWSSAAARLLALSALILGLAGLQWLRPQEGMNVIFMLDRSQSVPSFQQQQALDYINRAAVYKKPVDKAGLLVFGSDAAIELSPKEKFDQKTILAVVGTEQTDIAAAIRLGTAAFPENGQKRLVLLSDGNQNVGDASAALLAAKPLGVSLDVVPLGSKRGGDLSVQKLGLPSKLKKGQTFDVKIFAQSDVAQTATLRLFRNNQYLGEQKVKLSAGKNLLSFPQTLSEPGFYSYQAQVEGPHDSVAQNDRASGYVDVRGNPRVLIISASPKEDQRLAEALRQSRLDVRITGVNGFPSTLAEMQSYDTIFLSNVAAGSLSLDAMKLLESAVRDFGVGLVCVGGDQAFAAGGYRGTPLEETLPVDMDLSSKKVLPNGALVLVMHGMEFMNGNQISRQIALGALNALGPRDEMGVVLWDGKDRWLFPLQKVGDKKAMGRKIAGMNQGDLPSFQKVMEMAYAALKKSDANIKHIVVFSDGDPARPSQKLMDAIVGDKITVSSVLIAGHVGPQTMIWIAHQGHGRFYDVRSPAQLPQIFIKEAAVILKSAIYEQPFTPRMVSGSEMLRGFAPGQFPQLLGYVATTPKPRAEIPLVTGNGDPLLANWQFGLGRAVAFTSDAKAKWAVNWLGWPKYRQFWSQVAQWTLRRLQSGDFNTDVSIQNGVGHLNVEALDPQGNYRNFLNLQTVVVSPKGERHTVNLEQTGPGRYAATFPAKEVGSYLLNLMELTNGNLRASQVVGASVNYSPEFKDSGPNLNLLHRLAQEGNGRILKPQERPDTPVSNPFLHDRLKTFQPRDLWEWLLRAAIILFPVDVGLRRIQLDREEWLRATYHLRRWLFFWRKVKPAKGEEDSLGTLLARRQRARGPSEAEMTPPRPDLFEPERPVEGFPGATAPEAPKGSPAESGAEKKPAEEGKAPEEESSAKRLLDAKRRAQRWKR